MPKKGETDWGLKLRSFKSDLTATNLKLLIGSKSMMISCPVLMFLKNG